MKKRQPYPAYKSSGIEWLGDIPEGWELVRLRHIGNFASSGIDKKVIHSEPLVRMVNYTDIYSNKSLEIDSRKALMKVSCPEWKIQASNLIRGDLVFTPSSETREEVGLSVLITEDLENTVFSYHVIRFRFKKNVEFNYRKYLCNNTYVMSQFSKECKGTTRQILNRDEFNSVLVALPPLNEQRAIADFLKREAGRMDTLIEKKKRQIELLKEKRTALITHAVTKGLNPAAKMKDSGIEWLGDIPEHWDIKKLKHFSSVQFSNVDKHTTKGEEPVRLCNYVDVYYNEFITMALALMDATATQSEIRKFSLYNGDVLVTKDSEAWDDIAIPAYVEKTHKNTLCGYHLAQIRSNQKLIYSKYLFRSFCSKAINYQFRVAAAGITRYGLGKYWIDNGLFPVPPIDEQRAIAAFLDRETARIDVLIEKINKSIELLREYRTALISSAVTGKIDVREKAA